MSEIDLDFKEKLSALFISAMETELSIELITLCTSEGFPVHSHTRKPGRFEEDKMAAATSTLCSVSDAVANQILSNQFSAALVEALDGNMMFISLRNAGRDYVLTMAANKSVNVASLRLCINSLASELLSD